jgi:hypothetical protein
MPLDVPLVNTSKLEHILKIREACMSKFIFFDTKFIFFVETNMSDSVGGL